jgi:hypothetical protein
MWCGGDKGCPRSKYQAFMKKASIVKKIPEKAKKNFEEQ